MLVYCKIRVIENTYSSIFYAVLIHLTEKVKEGVENRNFACGIFIDFLKAFEIVDYGILIQELNYYGISNGFSNLFKDFKS